MPQNNQNTLKHSFDGLRIMANFAGLTKRID
jgi:hypothetical protein